MLYIRADGNVQIGMGHIMRCLSIAEAALALDAACPPVFLTADVDCADLITERGFALRVLGTDFRDMHAELPVLERIFMEQDGEQNGERVVLVDSYQADAAYFTALSRLARVVCLEDMGAPYPVDLLINYNLYAPKLKESYQIDEKPLNTRLGVSYLPLRSAFLSDMDYTVRDNVTDVMITTGGSDPHFAADAFAAAFLELFSSAKQKITLHIVSGPFNAFAGRLKEKYGCYENVVIHEGLKDLKALMRSCDVALTAAGSTVYELCALGVPMIAFYFAENQRQGAEELARLTELVNAGGFCEDRTATVNRAVMALKKCMEDQVYRERLSQQERSLVDGKGAARIAEELALWRKRKKDN